MKIFVVTESDCPTIQFARQELDRYIRMINEQRYSAETYEIKIGLISGFFPERQCSASGFDDEIYISIQSGSGIVAGGNPRSCLLAVYRLLREAGCRFLRPGEAGEAIPKRNWRDVSVRVDEKPSYRHRGICIEGAVSKEIFLDMIDWLPKNGMNSYFVQFRSGHTFFERWYAHRHNPRLELEYLTPAQTRSIVEEGIKAIKLRGLIYHEVGHGWTCEPLGIPALGWDQVDTVPQGALEALALVNGRRELWGGVPLNTNLCYGNKKNQDLVIGSIVSYLQQNPDVDILHFWLADGSNNHCECPLCTDSRPSDLYVDLLNRLDERLTKLGIQTKIVFLIYFDLLWPPEKQRILNPDRFILMFAPITRTYSKAFTTDTALPTLPGYVRNRLDFPSTVEGNLSFLEAWKTIFPGDSFDFDYHLLWDQYKEPTSEPISEVLYEDIRNLQIIGLDGLMSCQVQRSFFPTPLPMAVLARTLWNRDTEYASLASELYSDAFGDDGQRVREALQQLSALFSPGILRMEEPVNGNAKLTRQLAGVAEVTRALRELVAVHVAHAEGSIRESWRILGLYCTYIEKYADFCLALATENQPAAKEALDELILWAFSEEEDLGYAFDCDTMRYTLEDACQRFFAKQ